MKIGSISKILDLTPETIRYYESEGIIDPARKADSGYRDYTVHDLSHLIQCMKYRAMGFSLKDVSAIMQADTLNDLENRIAREAMGIESKIRAQSVLFSYMCSLREKINAAEYNVGNYWVRTVPSVCLLPFFTRNGEEYTGPDEDAEILRSWLSNAPFCETFLEYTMDEAMSGTFHNCDKWYLGIRKDDFTFLEVERTSHVHDFFSHMALHTVTTFDEDGVAVQAAISDAREYMAAHGLRLCGNVLGQLIAEAQESPVPGAIPSRSRSAKESSTRSGKEAAAHASKTGTRYIELAFPIERI